VTLSLTKQRKAQRRARRKRGKSWCRVYYLCGADMAPRYVGQTRQILSDRLKWHFKDLAKSNSPLYRWLREQPLEQVDIVELDGEGVWDVSEVIWIERLTARGESLLNATRGGRDNWRPHG